MYTFMIVMGVVFCVLIISGLIIGGILFIDFVMILKQEIELLSKKYEHITERERELTQKLNARINEVDQKLRGRCHVLELKMGLTPEELKRN